MDAAEDSDESAEIEEIISFIQISRDGVVLAVQTVHQTTRILKCP